MTVNNARCWLGLYFRLLRENTHAHAEGILSFHSQLRYYLRGPTIPEAVRFQPRGGTRSTPTSGPSTLE
jgi:hypothetical protein